jgi:hypothetical protein
MSLPKWRPWMLGNVCFQYVSASVPRYSRYLLPFVLKTKNKAAALAADPRKIKVKPFGYFPGITVIEQGRVRRGDDEYGNPFPAIGCAP